MLGSDLFEITAQQIQGPNDLVLWSNGQGPAAKSWTTCTERSQIQEKRVCAVGLHELRIAVALGRRTLDESLARAVDAKHLYRLADGRKVSLLHCSIVFGAVDLASVLASMKEFPACELALEDLGLSVADLATDQTAGKSTLSAEVQHECYLGDGPCVGGCGTLWQGEWWSWQLDELDDDSDTFFTWSRDGGHGSGRWVQCPELNSSFVLGGAQKGIWAPDWSSDLSAARAWRDKPSVHAALAAVSQGRVKLSPDVAFHLLDAAILFGNVAAARELVDQGVTSTPLRLWHASDLLPCYGFHSIFPEDDQSGNRYEFIELDVPEPEVVHAASLAKINLSSLQCFKQHRRGDFDFESGETLLGAIVEKAPLETAQAMVEVAGGLEALNLPREALNASLCDGHVKFQIFDRAIQLGLHVEDITAETFQVTFALLSDMRKAWWQKNPCPGHRICDVDDLEFEYYKFDMNILDLAVLQCKKDFALHLAGAGAEFTDGGAFAIRGLLVDAVIVCDDALFWGAGPHARAAEIHQIAMDVARIQSKRELHAALQIAQIPLLQAMTSIRRREQLPRIRVVTLICEFLARRWALADLDSEIESLAKTETESESEAKLEEPQLKVQVGKQVSESDIEQAIELSKEGAAQEEAGHLAAAFIQSKIEAPPLSGDDVVSYRLTCTSKIIAKTLLEAPQLAAARARVVDAGCDLQPDFAGGATFLIPITREQFLELNLDLKPHHVVTIRAEKTLLEAALAGVRSKKRPTVKNDHRAKERRQEEEQEEEDEQEKVDPAHPDLPQSDRLHPFANSSQVDLLEERTIGILVPMVRHTFIHFTEDQGSTKASVKSAPF